MERVLQQVRERKVTLQDLHKSRESAEEIGILGERLCARYLDDLRDSGEITDYEWTSNLNAIAPYDFHVCRSGSWEKLEIKTTTGSFLRNYYLPRSELLEMAYGDEPYRIGRIYGANLTGARMRLSSDLKVLGRAILSGCGALPSGVTLNGVTIVPMEEQFGNNIDLALPDGVEQ